MTLNQWQERLQQHFQELKEQRKASDFEVFALEHGLERQHIDDLETQIREYSKHTSPSDRHWLVWAVYAAEVGYSYSGDEYWQTFSDKTPGWDRYNDRDFIRNAFKRFKREFHGVTPSGPWASQFTIISWPITHAILPQDLQRQLAETLFNIRYQFNSQLLSSPEVLGQRIDEASWKAGSSRFQQFAEQHLLVGQIASALLSSDESLQKCLILPATLKRIAADLDGERRAREWLSRARKEAFGVKISGFRKGTTCYGSNENEDSESAKSPRQQLERLGIEPSLSLRRVGKIEWDLRLRLPSFDPLLTRFPQFKSILTNERCHVAGAKEKRPLARRALLFGTQEVVLTKWPKKGEVLLNFDKSSPELNYLLHTECLIRSGPRWLFKLGSDGTAVEVKTGVIRPGTQYLVLGETAPAFNNISASPVKILCSGVQGVLVHLPSVLTHSVSSEFENLGYSPASSLSAWPVGLPAAKWDDEGGAEYLSTVEISIAVSTEFQHSGIVLNLQGSCPSRIEIPPAVSVEPVLVHIGTLPPGSHFLHLITKHNEHVITGGLHIGVREPVPSSTPSNLISVLAAPPNPRMEEIWDGSASIGIYAPEGSRVSCELEFFSDSACSNRILAKSLGYLNPADNANSFSKLLENVRQQSAIQNAYDEAAGIALRFSAGALGESILTCEREQTICRWAVKRENQAYWLRLVQTDEVRVPKFFFSNFSDPGSLVPIPSSWFDGPMRVPDAGGLYFATVDGCECTVVIPPVIRSFQDLGSRFAQTDRRRNEKDLFQVLRAVELWSGARVVGDPLSALRKRNVIEHMFAWVVKTLCGDYWRENDGNATSVRIATKCLQHRDPRIAFSVQHHQQEFGSAPINIVAATLARIFSERLPAPSPPISLVMPHNVSSLQWLTEFCLRLFTDPGGARRWAGPEFVGALHYLLLNGTLVRSCRVVSLMRNEGEEVFAEGAHA